jgi:capsular polysaccharide biosynthesis protein
MEIMRLLEGFKRRLWMIVSFAVVGGVLAGILSFMLSSPQYQASATVLAINSEKAKTTGEALDTQDFAVSQMLIKNYGAIIDSYSVNSEAIRNLKNYNLTVDDLHNIVSIDFKKDANIIVVTAETPDAKMSADIANAISNAFIGKVALLTNSKSMAVLDEAKIPQAPMPSGNTKKILIGILAGLAIACGIVYIKELFDTTVRTAEDVEQNLGLKVIGIIPEHGIR